MRFVPFMDVCDIQGGTQPPKSEWISSPKEGYVRMLQIRDFTQPDNPKVEYVKEKSSLKKCESDDILIARYGASIGRILTGLSGAYNVAMAKCTYDDSELERRYLYHWLNSDNFQRAVSGFGGRAAQAGFNKKDLSNLDFPLPTLEEQKRIAKILDAADALRAKRRESLAQLDALLQSTFLDLFGDPVSNPKHWPVFPLGSEVKVIGGYAFKSADFSEEGAPVIRISNLSSDGVDISSCARIPLDKLEKGVKFKILPGDTLIAMSGATVGKIGYVPDDLDDDWYLNQRVGAFRVTKESRISRSFLRAVLATPFYQGHVLDLAGGAAQPNISGRQLESALIPCPPSDEQRKYDDVLRVIDRMKITERMHLNDLNLLFGSLQQKAFSGEL